MIFRHLDVKCIRWHCKHNIMDAFTHSYCCICHIATYMSLPQHVAKLPSWLAQWYCRHCWDLARHVYISCIDSLMSCLRLSSMPHFDSEAILSPYPPIWYPWGVFAIVTAHRYSGLFLDYGNSPIVSRLLIVFLSPLVQALLSLLSLYFTSPHLERSISSTLACLYLLSRVSCAI